MKKLLTYLPIFAFCTFAAVSCGGSEDIPPVKPGDGPIAVAPASLNFTVEGSTETVTVTGKNWKATTQESWIEITVITASMLPLAPTQARARGAVR